jgi:hypothetical protein
MMAPVDDQAFERASPCASSGDQDSLFALFDVYRPRLLRCRTSGTSKPHGAATQTMQRWLHARAAPFSKTVGQ